MEARSHSQSGLGRDRAVPEPAEGVQDDDFSRRITVAENINLRERLGRLEASIAFWAADVDAANEDSARLRAEIDGLRSQLRAAKDQSASAENSRATLLEAVADRDAHIAMLEGRVVDHDLQEIDSHRTRSRLQALRRRVRARMGRQAREIEGLRRTVNLGHAARLQVEEELRSCRLDVARNARYLDKLEERITLLRGK